MTGHDFGPVLFRGKTIQAMLTAWAVPQEEGCVGCSDPLLPGEYFYIHESGGAWHSRCHWAAKPRPQRITPTLAPTQTFRVSGMGKGNIKEVPKKKTFF